MDKPKMGRPPLPDDVRRIRESIYFAPDVHKWLKDRSEVRSASMSSFLNVLVKDRMLKEKK